jgi:hypothetical protein
MINQDTARFNLSYYGVDFTVDTLILKLQEEEIVVPHFQRDYVWKIEEASRFIESLILRLPVPSIFLLRDKHTNRYIIVDGQQRLKTLMYFFQESFPDGKIFKLKKVVHELENKRYSNLSLSDQRELKNSIIHCVVIMDEENSDAPFHLFERLNTTGTPLTNQEIRSALYFGRFNDLLANLSKNEHWKTLVKKDNRLTDQEYILRLVAIYFELENYNGNMSHFLNQLMIRNRDLEKYSIEDIQNFFLPTIEIIASIYKRIDLKFNITFSEPIFYNISKSLSQLQFRIQSIEEAIIALKNDEEYAKLIKSSTTSKKSFQERIEYVRHKFGL